MNTVTALKFNTPEGAEKALGVIRALQKEHLITLHDAAIVTWPAGKKKPKTWQLVDLPSAGALSGMFWGTLFGLIFLNPLFGMVSGTVFGAIGGAMRDYGIDDDFIGSIRRQVTTGTSALFLMTSDAVQDRVIERLKDLKFEIIATNLSKEQQQKLHEAFGQE
jgi:uncharacterized membrane protein